MSARISSESRSPSSARFVIPSLPGSRPPVGGGWVQGSSPKTESERWLVPARRRAGSPRVRRRRRLEPLHEPLHEIRNRLAVRIAHSLVDLAIGSHGVLEPAQLLAVPVALPLDEVPQQARLVVGKRGDERFRQRLDADTVRARVCQHDLEDLARNEPLAGPVLGRHRDVLMLLKEPVLSALYPLATYRDHWNVPTQSPTNLLIAPLALMEHVVHRSGEHTSELQSP